MMFFFDYLLYSLGVTYALYVLYCAVMNIKRVQEAGKFTLVGKVLGIPTLVLGLVFDALCNITVMTVLLMELPREWLVTTRLKRHHATSTGWRLTVVKFFEPILDPLDPSGDHV